MYDVTIDLPGLIDTCAHRPRVHRQRHSKELVQALGSHRAGGKRVSYRAAGSASDETAVVRDFNAKVMEVIFDHSSRDT